MIQYAGNSKAKRSKLGCEARWNKLGEPFSNMLGGSFKTIDTWVNRKVTRSERKYNHLTDVEPDTTGVQQVNANGGAG